MGDDETGDGEVREGGVDRLLSLHVEVRSALVEDQDPGPAIERPREQHTLLLATGERRTHVPDQALVAHRHAFDVGFDLGEIRALAHPRHVDLLVEPRDVLGERALQEAVILRDEGDLAEKLVKTAEKRLDCDCAAAGTG